MTDEEVNYQFNGYNLPMEQLDETGPAYIVIPEPHPYYRNQPTYWSRPAYGGLSSNQGIIGNDIEIDKSGNVQSGLPPKSIGNFNPIPMDLI